MPTFEDTLESTKSPEHHDAPKTIQEILDDHLALMAKMTLLLDNLQTRVKNIEDGNLSCYSKPVTPK